MMRTVLMILSLVVVAAVSLTAVKAPTVRAWKLAIVVSEFGIFLLTIPVVIAVLTVGGGGAAGGWRSIVTLVACAVASGFLIKPVIQAKQVAAKLPAQLTGAFGAVELGREPFSLNKLVHLSGGDVTAEPRVFKGEGTAEALTLDFYRATSRAPAPCVVIVHGGGWDNGGRAQLPALNSHLALRGYAVAAVEYRLAPKNIWPAQRDDVRAGLAYLKSHASELGIDATRFVLLGRSAGGQIAESVAYNEPDPAVCGVIAMYAPADMEFAWKYTDERDVLDSKKLMRQLTGGTPETARAAFDSASPYLQVGHGAVPTLLMHGRIDALVWNRQSERLAEKLNAAGVPCVFLDLPWATHAFDFNLHGPGGQLSTYAIDWFLDAVTAGKK
jgi:acetyl esterase/lipase